MAETLDAKRAPARSVACRDSLSVRARQRETAKRRSSALGWFSAVAGALLFVLALPVGAFAAPSRLVASGIERAFALTSQTITFGALAGKTYGNAPFTVGATASSGLAVSFASTTTAVCTVSGATVTLVAAGMCTIQASQAGNATYAAAPNVNQSFTVAKAAQTITFGALAGKTYGNAAFAVSATASSGLVVTFASTTTTVCTVTTATVTLVAAGTCTIQATQAGNGNYNAATAVNQSFTVAKAAQTITFGALTGKTFGAAPFAVSATASSGLTVAFASTTTAVCTVSGTTVTIVAGGPCTIQATQAGNGNYNGATAVNQSFTVAKATQTITFGALTGKTYGAAPFTVSATASSGLTVAFASTTTAVCTASGTTVTLVAGGTCTIQATQPGNGNYSAATAVNQSFTVTKAAQTITFGALANQSLGTAPFTVSATASSGLAVTFTSITTSVCTVSGSTVTLVAGGTCTIRAAQAGNAAYAAATSVNQSFTVTQGQTITFPAVAEQVLGAGPVTLTATASSGLAVTYTSLTAPVCGVSGATVTVLTVGSCTIQASQSGNASYTAAPNVSRTFGVILGAQFAPQTTYAAGALPFGMATGDLNGDAKLDLVVANENDGTVSVYLGNGDGTFTLASTLPFAGAFPVAVALGDFNGDGKLDLVVGNGTDGTIVYYPGNGNGTFGTLSLITVGGRVNALAVGDLNRDGKLDLIATAGSLDITQPQAIAVLLGNGNDTFQPAVNYATDAGPMGLVLGDFNGDGILDVAVACYKTNTVSVLRGNANGTLGSATSYGAGINPIAVVAADFSGDGRLDLAVANEGSNSVSILLGNASGTFGTALDVPVGTGPQFLAVGDLNGDGRVDLAVTNSFENDLSILLGVGDGTFHAAQFIATGNYPLGVVVGDFNRDGKPDLALANGLDNTIGVLLNTAAFTPVASLSVQSGTPQSTPVSTAYATPLAVLARDAASNPIAGAAVTFSAPASGASGQFGAGSTQASVTTGANGVATAPTLTANAVGGAFSVTAHASLATATFTLANTGGAPQAPTFISAPPPSGVVNISYSYQLVASGSPIPAFSVTGNPLPPGLALNATSGLISGTPSTVGAYTGSVAATNGILPNASQSFAITVAAANQTITFNALAGAAYGSGPLVVNATASSGLAVTFSSLTSSVCTVSGNSVALVGVGICTIQAAQSGNAVYAPAVSVTQSFAVSQGVQTISFGTLPGQTIGAAPFNISATASSGLPVGFVSLTPSVCAASGTLVTLFVTGVCTIEGFQSGNALYQAATPADQSFSVAHASQAISFPGLGIRLFGSAPFTISATASSGLTVTFTPLTPPVCAVSGATVTLSALGTCTIQAGQSGDSNFSAATSVTQSFSVRRAPQFGNAISYPLGAYPNGFAAGDFNRDGKPDLAVVLLNQTVAILLSNGDGTFSTGQVLSTGTVPDQIAVDDFNGDGKLDLAVASLAGNSVIIYLGNGDGTFQHSINLGVTAPYGIVAADLNSDGWRDLVVTNRVNGTSDGRTVTVLLGNGDGTFQPGVSYTVGARPTAVVVGDFNGDGKPDLAVANMFDNTISLLLGAGDGTFPTANTLTTHTSPQSLVAADFNSDHKLDLAVVNATTGDVSILLGNGDGSFGATTNYATGNFANSIAVADIAGDGILDLAITQQTGNDVVIMSGAGDGTFGNPLTFAAGSSPLPILVVDFNQDGKPDLAVADYSGNNISILLNSAVLGQVASIVAQAGTPQSTPIGTTFAAGLTVLVRDAASQPLPGMLVTFSAPTNGASASFSGGTESVQVMTGLTGVAGAPAAMANRVAGSYSVTAKVAGVSTSFALTNVATGIAPQFTSSAPPSGTYGAAYNYGLTVSGSPTSTFALIGGTLPAGLMLNGITGVISGIPTAGGNFAGVIRADNGVASAATQAFSINVVYATQSIVFAAIPDQLAGSSPIALTASASSGLAVSFRTLTPSVCVVGGTSVVLLGAGTCTIEATQGGNSIYAAAPVAGQSFSIVASAQVITFSLPASVSVIDQTEVVSATASSGLPVGLVSLTPTICQIDGVHLHPTLPGTCTIRASQPGNGSFGPAPDVDRGLLVLSQVQSISFPPIADHNVNDGSLPLTASTQSGLPIVFSSSTASVCIVNGTSVTLVAVGTCTIQASQAGSAYFSAVSVSRSFSVTTTGYSPAPVVVGPSIQYLSYFGGSGDDGAFDIAVGPDGSAYVGVAIASTDFPGLPSDSVSNGGVDLLAIAKINPNGGSLDFAAAVGARTNAMTGSGQFAYVGTDQVEAMAIDPNGNVFAAAYANSFDYPQRGGLYTRVGPKAIYKVTGLNSVQAVSATIDPAVQTIRALAVDGSGGIYFTGVAGPGLATTAGAAISAAQATTGGPYLIKLTQAGAVVYATYLSVAGSRAISGPPVSQNTTDAATTAYAIAVDAAGNAYLAGQASAKDFPVTPGSSDTTDTQNRDAFVAKVSPGGSALLFVARVGGSDADRATSIALSPDGTIVVGGKTASAFTGGNAFQNYVTFAPQTSIWERETGFVGKLANDGKSWSFLAALGTWGGDLVPADTSPFSLWRPTDMFPLKVAVGPLGAIYAAGLTAVNRTLPITTQLSGVQPTGAFLLKLAADGQLLTYATGLGTGVPMGLAVDGFGNAYVAGYSLSGLPAVRAAQAGPAYESDVSAIFVAKINDQGPPLNLAISQNPAVAGQSITLSATLADGRFAGSVEFDDGARALGSVAVVNGRASLALALTAGVHRVRAIFRGAGPLDGIASAEVVVTVNQATTGP